MDENKALSSTDAPLWHNSLILFNLVTGILASSCQSESTWVLIFEAKPLWSFHSWFNPDLTSGLSRFEVNDPFYSAISLCISNHCYSSQGFYYMHYSPGVYSHRIMQAVKGDFRLQLGETWQVVLKSSVNRGKSILSIIFASISRNQQLRNYLTFSNKKKLNHWHPCQSPKSFTKKCWSFYMQYKIYKENKVMGSMLNVLRDEWTYMSSNLGTLFHFFFLTTSTF